MHGVQMLPGYDDFNPRTPVGCDPKSRIPLEQLKKISIHAPQWGATAALVDDDWIIVFQSTHPSGVRRVGDTVQRHQIDFNPRTPVGCDRENGHSIP